MIKKIILPLLAILILSSCSDKFGMMKRRYNKGYYVSHRSDPAGPSVAHGLKKEHKAGKIAAPNEKTIPTAGNHVITLQTKPDLGEKTVLKQKNVTASGKRTAPKKQMKKTEALLPVIYQRDLKKLPEEVRVKLQDLASTTAKDDSGDVKLILLVILAIFIPPLAVYLKNETIDKWFWITLILCLLSFTALFFLFGGGFWLIAMIIAILYVFDAIK